MKTVWDLLRESFKRWKEVKAQRLGAALAYYTVFSLAPLLIIAILIAGAVFGQAAAQERIIGQVSALVGPQGAAGVASLVAQHPFPGNSGGLATVISLGTLLLGAIGLFGQLQDAFDTVWDVTPPPSKGVIGLIKQHIVPFGMLLAVCFLLLVALLVNTALAAISAYLGPFIPYFAVLNTAINVILPIVVSTLLFAALFKYVTDAHLAWRHLWPGAALTAVLFTLGKILIGLYLGHTSLASASGAAGSLLVVLVWVYYSAQILLFGAVFTHVYGRHQGWQPVLASAAGSHSSGKPRPAQSVTASTMG
jgi:membrane protein